MDDVDAKVPYDPTENRRFEISHDEFSRERIKALLSAHKTLKEEIPFYAGMTLYGSLSKGKVLTKETAAVTDIDLIAFVDTDRFAETIDSFETENEEFRHYFANEYMKKPQATAKDMNQVRPRNIELAAEMFIAKKIQEIVHAETTILPIAAENVHVELESLNLSDEGSSLFSAATNYDGLIDLLRGIGSPTEAVLAAQQPLAYPFFYDIGGGLMKYRKAFFEKLLSLTPEEGQRYWKLAVEAMKSWERKKEIPESIAHTFPPTLAEAVKYYTTGKSTIES